MFSVDRSINIILLFEENQNMPTPHSYILNYLAKTMGQPLFFSTVTIHFPDGVSLANSSATATANADAYVPWALTVD